MWLIKSRNILVRTHSVQHDRKELGDADAATFSVRPSMDMSLECVVELLLLSCKLSIAALRNCAVPPPRLLSLDAQITARTLLVFGMVTSDGEGTVGFRTSVFLDLCSLVVEAALFAGTRLMIVGCAPTLQDGAIEDRDLVTSKHFGTVRTTLWLSVRGTGGCCKHE